MIRVFSPNDKIFMSNGGAVIQLFKANVHKEDNGKSEIISDAERDWIQDRVYTK